jgi:hypothetical protein
LPSVCLGLPSVCRRFAIGLPSVCHRFAIGLPSVCHRFAVGRRWQPLGTSSHDKSAGCSIGTCARTRRDARQAEAGAPGCRGDIS